MGRLSSFDNYKLAIRDFGNGNYKNHGNVYAHASVDDLDRLIFRYMGGEHLVSMLECRELYIPNRKKMMMLRSIGVRIITNMFFLYRLLEQIENPRIKILLFDMIKEVTLSPYINERFGKFIIDQFSDRYPEWSVKFEESM